MKPLLMGNPRMDFNEDFNEDLRKLQDHEWLKRIILKLHKLQRTSSDLHPVA